MLARSKSMHGLGFHELETFSKVLLTKRDARILNEPEALSIQTIKRLYFLNSDFCSAKKVGKASWVWASIIHCRGVVYKKGGGGIFGIV